MVGAFLIYLVKVQRAMELLSAVNGKGERSTFFQLNFWSNVFAQFVWIHHKNKDRYFFFSLPKNDTHNGTGKRTILICHQQTKSSNCWKSSLFCVCLERRTFLVLLGPSNSELNEMTIVEDRGERAFVFPLPQITCSNKWKIYCSVRSPVEKLQSAPVFRRRVLEYSDSSVLSHRASLFYKHTTLFYCLS